MEDNGGFIVYKLPTGGVSKITAQQIITVAAHEKQASACPGKPGKFGGNFRMRRCPIIISGPRLEQIAQDVQGPGRARRSTEQGREQLKLVRPVITHMQI